MNPISTLNKSLGQKKRKFKNGANVATFGCLGVIFLWGFKLAFFPFTLVYYGFLKKDVNPKWKLVFKILSIIVFTFLALIVISAAYNSSDEMNNANTGKSTTEAIKRN